MGFRDYQSLCNAVAEWLARDDLATPIKDFIWLTECDLQREVKFRTRDTIEEGTTVDGQDYIELPDDYAEGAMLSWSGNTSLPTLEVASLAQTLEYQKNVGFSPVARESRVASVRGNRLYVGGAPGEVAYTLHYKAGVQHLSDEVPTNYILEQYPDCLLYGALKHSAPFVGADERAPMWNAEYERAKGETRAQEFRGRTGHGVLRMRADVRVY